MADKAFFITGTDTGCGKTLAAESLLIALKKQGLRVAGMKPVATGAEKASNGLVNNDALCLQEQSSAPLAYTEVNPFAFEMPYSPNFAAEKAGKEINLKKIKSAYQKLQSQADVVIIEGIGGWRVPLSSQLYASDIAKILRVPVIFVAGLRLGCINHAILSIEAIERDDVPLKGWIANHLDPAYAAGQETEHFLQSRINAPLLGAFPCINNHSVSGGDTWKYLDLSAVL